MTAYHELDIFFDLQKLAGREYSSKAKEVFFKNCSPLMLRDSQIFAGESRGPSPGAEQMFCIAIRTEDAAVIGYLKNIFAAAGDSPLAPPHDRLRESDFVARSRLKHIGNIDGQGRLITSKWSRIDHDLCKRYGWPYVPRSFPRYIAPIFIEELEKMSDPANAAPAASVLKESGTRSSRSRNVRLPPIGRYLLYFACACILLLVAGWVFLGGGEQYLKQAKGDVSERLQLGSEAHDRKQKGYALAALSKLSHDLNGDELNGKLEQKYYHVLGVPNSPHADVRLDCSVWFATSEMFRPNPQTLTQGFIKMEMRARNGSLIWTCLATGSAAAPGRESENESLRVDALRNAIEEMDMACLPDGRSVRDLQEHRDFEGVNNMVRHLSEKREQVRSEDVSRAEWDSFREQVLESLRQQWIMSHRVHLSTGSSLDAIILEEQENAFRFRVARGFISIPKEQIKIIEPLAKEAIAQSASKLAAGKKDAPWWQAKIAEEAVADFSEWFIQFGPFLPGAYVVEIRPNQLDGELEAVVNSQQKLCVLRKGGEIEGFRVIGIDAENKQVLLTKGTSGGVLRIWPERIEKDAPQPAS
ncbi:MAG: hypothetical protein C4520_12320 [Candidatus Abyssobacteria bacterium SURF_5]|uniref:Uncharacterized protein n=1 Tax=Abyssobacteria bacterium (strain SURF_5) TaxID=2093360 RepID=A0A3A4NG21_ABYX5|nr:MAG: hypothetical protein C4520_12320 [Candidatus Abyssubacteria bacterium SURF_5]